MPQMEEIQIRDTWMTSLLTVLGVDHVLTNLNCKITVVVTVLKIFGTSNVLNWCHWIENSKLNEISSCHCVEIGTF